VTKCCTLVLIVTLGCLSRTSTTTRTILQERLVPNPGNGGVTVGASPIPDPVLSDTETKAFKEEGVAMGAGRIFPASDMSGDIPGIHVAEACGSPDLGSTD